MYIAVVPNRKSPPAVLLRESYREGGKVKNRTLANLSRFPNQQIELLRRVLKGETLVGLSEAFVIERSLPHGHVAAVLGTLRKLGLERLLGSRRSRRRDLVVAMIVARILDPRSKLAIARGLNDASASDSLGEVLELGVVEADELYEAMDWLGKRQPRIEAALAKKHLTGGTLVLYDVTSTYFEGRTCPLAQYGYSRDGKRDHLQIVFGVLCNVEGCPVAVEVFEGNVSDPKTVASQIQKLRERFQLQRIVLVGDRGMLTSARLRDDLKPHEEIAWITALRAPAIRQLVQRGSLQRSLFDEQDLVEISDPEYPNERLVACRNPLLAEERTRKREALLERTERDLAKVVEAAQRTKRPLRGRDKIGLRVGRVLGKHKMAKHFLVEIEDDRFSYRRNTEKINEEAALDGIYVVRTSVPAEEMAASDVVRGYKGLSKVERAFRTLKLIDLKVRPIHHRLADRVRAHVFLCLLAYYVEWHLRRCWAPLLFDDEDFDGCHRPEKSPVAAAERSLQAKQKAAQQHTEEGFPVHSFRTLLKDLETLARNRTREAISNISIIQYTTPTPLQTRAFQLLDLNPTASP